MNFLRSAQSGTIPTHLGQATPPPGEVIGLLAWIVGAAIAAGVLLFCVRLWFKKQEDETTTSSGLGFTLSDLREMLAQGQIDEEEFETAKARMIGHSTAQLEAESSPELTAEARMQAARERLAAEEAGESPDGFFIEPVEEEGSASGGPDAGDPGEDPRPGS